MNSIEKLLAENIDSLESLYAILKALPSDKYAEFDSDFFEASIGQHVRHALDHYLMLAGGIKAGIVDYDARPRDKGVETDIGIAHKQIEQLIESYRNIQPVDIELDIKLDISQIATSPISNTQRSTLARELSFVYLHAVHHYAIIKLMLKSLAPTIELSNFGIAPSTVKYRETLRCAP